MTQDAKVVGELNHAWRCMLPASVWSATDVISDRTGLITAEDGFAIWKYAPRRQMEFSTSRSLVYELMRIHGLKLPGGLPSGEEGAPQWPRGVVGSITHSRGLCSVAITQSHDHSMLGIDLEQLGRMKPTIWSRIASEDEMRSMQGWAEEKHQGMDVAMTALFSIKEAFFKAQYPLTKRYLGFLDVKLQLTTDGHLTIAAPVSLPSHDLCVSHTERHVLSAVLSKQ